MKSENKKTKDYHGRISNVRYCSTKDIQSGIGAMYDSCIDAEHMSNKITGLIVSVINSETRIGSAYEHINDILYISEDVKRKVEMIIGKIKEESKLK
jgi:hypothetical protein